ncbi:MAG: hypothetical protein ACFFEV_10785, partial [Candidatus Thorarchaeota archaeon]
NSSSNLAGYTQLPTHVISGAGWENATVSSIILDANTEYYAVINGSALIETTFYPDIRWIAETAAGSYTTQQYDSRFALWGNFPSEALLNYTYIPWNTTTNAALVFSNTDTIDLNLNGTPVSGSTWTTNSLSNITSLQISTNQSVSIFHNLTLSYKKDVTASTNWIAESSSAPIKWNVTINLAYPTVPETVTQFMNITNIPADWTPTGLYNGTIPSGSYSKTGSNVTCNSLSNGFWTLASTAPNYAVDLDLSDSSNDSPISYKVANTVTMNINATISTSGGTTNLSIIHSSTIIYTPIEIAADSGGAADFQWDIDATTTGNATHSVEVYWVSSDQLEAGYITQEVFVFHSTTLVADDYSITNYTESSFDIGVDFDSIYPAVGLGDSPADVTFDFAGVYVNQSMNNPSGGRWIYSVDTTGVSSGIYPLVVYAEGFAIENQSLTIWVDLTIETKPLNWSWSPSNTITYLNSTILNITYQDSNNNRIPDAWVNVTFDAQTFNLTWDAFSETYWIQLNGTDFLTVPGSTLLTVNAWKADYTSQYNDSISITVNEEPTGIGLVVNWNPVDRNITYIETVTITASYTYNSYPINDTWDGVWVRATFSGYPLVNLTYNGVSELWEITLDGSDYLGVTSVTIVASATGYGQENAPAVDLIVTEDIPTLTNSWTDSAASTDYDTNILLQITVRDSSGAFINGATLSANVFATDYPLAFNGDGVYSILIDPQEAKGVHVITVTITEYGYATTSTLLNLTVIATTDINVDYTTSEYEQWNLTIAVAYTDSFYSIPVTGATVTVTIDGVEFTLIYDSGEYVGEILLDFAPGVYTISVVANAQYCDEATITPSLTIQAKDSVYLSIETEGDPSAEGQVLS